MRAGRRPWRWEATRSPPALKTRFRAARETGGRPGTGTEFGSGSPDWAQRRIKCEQMASFGKAISAYRRPLIIRRFAHANGFHCWLFPSAPIAGSHPTYTTGGGEKTALRRSGLILSFAGAPAQQRAVIRRRRVHGRRRAAAEIVEGFDQRLAQAALRERESRGTPRRSATKYRSRGVPWHLKVITVRRLFRRHSSGREYRGTQSTLGRLR